MSYLHDTQNANCLITHINHADGRALLQRSDETKEQLRSRDAVRRLHVEAISQF